MEEFRIDLGTKATLLPPLSTMGFLNLWKEAAIVLTDSGGMQEETTALGVPRFTRRENAELIPAARGHHSQRLAGKDLS